MSNRFRLEELFNQADLDIKDGYFESAFGRLEQLLVEDPLYGKAYNHLGWLYETKLKDYRKAEEFYKKALDTDPDYHPVYTNYSILLSTLGKYDELKLLLDRALTVPGIDKANVFNEYGIMYEQMKDFNKAITFYKQCAEMTLSKDTLNRAMESMERCKLKMTL
jgi:tetratricopeptide (TPR) repeat protein